MLLLLQTESPHSGPQVMNAVVSLTCRFFSLLLHKLTLKCLLRMYRLLSQLQLRRVSNHHNDPPTRKHQRVRFPCFSSFSLHRFGLMLLLSLSKRNVHIFLSFVRHAKYRENSPPRARGVWVHELVLVGP